MGFNFGAMLGGAATQIVEDINEKEKDVKLRTRTILDRQVAQTAANQKEYKANKKKVTEQMNALIGMFGNTPDGIAKARSIVAGGDGHFNNVYTKLQAYDGDVNEIVSLTKGSEDIGFKGVEDAVGSLVKMAELPQIKTGSGFGSKYFEQQQQVYRDQGLIQKMQMKEDVKGSYGQVKVDFKGLLDKVEGIDKKIDRAYDAYTKETDPTKKAALKEVHDGHVNQRLQNSVAYQIKKMEAEADTNTTLKQISLNFSQNRKEYLSTIYNKDNKVINSKGEVERDEQAANAIVSKKRKEYNMSVLDGYLDGNGVFNNPNAEKFVNSNPTLKALLGEARRIKVGEDNTSSEVDGTQSQEQKTKKVNETITNIASNNPIGGDSVYQIISAAGVKVRDPLKLEAIIKKAYKDASEIEIAKAVQVALQRIKKEDIENKGVDDAYKRNIDAIRNPNKVSAPVAKGNPEYDQQKNVIKEREKLKRLEERDKKGIFG